MPNMSSNNSSTNTVFHDYFSDKVRLLSLCNALVDTNYTDPRIMEIHTLQGNFFSNRKNEIACRAGKNLFILVENHTFINPNIAFRFIGYLAQILKNLAVNKESNTTKNEFSLPSPHCCIFYYGDKNDPITKKIKLSDSFINSTGDSIELVITAYNINPEVNQPLFVNCRHLHDYGRLIDKIKKGITGRLDSQTAISKAIGFCLANGVMKNYLEKNHEEVFNMLALQWDSDAALQARFDEGFEEGIEFVATNMIRKGLSFDEISELTNLAPERLKELAQSN